MSKVAQAKKLYRCGSCGMTTMTRAGSVWSCPCGWCVRKSAAVTVRSAAIATVAEPPKDHRPPQIVDICTRVCDMLQFEPVMLVAPRRHPRFVVARELIVAIARRRTTLSYPELAPFVSCRRPNTVEQQASHTTALTAHRRYESKKDWPMELRLGKADADILGVTGMTGLAMVELLERHIG